jgi:hypothetical protein
LFALSLEAAAQEELRGRIFYTQGDSFTITARGLPQVYEAETFSRESLFLAEGDMLQTGPGSFVEIQFTPGGTVIKIAENTTFVFTGGDDPVSLTLLYGRLRLITGSEGGNVSLQAGGGSVGLARGDLGLDYFVRPDQYSPDPNGGARPRLQVYDFRGNAEITLLPAGGGALYPAGTAAPAEGFPSPLSPIPVKPLEMVSVEVLSSLHYIERKPIPADILDYWDQNNFRGSPPVTMPDTALPRFDPSLASIRPVQTTSGSGRRSLGTLLKNNAVLFGISLTGIGAGMQAYGAASLYNGNYDMARTMSTWGFLPIGMGLAFLITSIFFNPVLP